MKVIYEMKGKAYHELKNEIKGMMRQHGIKWTGSFEHPKWEGRDDKITAFYDRVDGVTQSATLTWESNRVTNFILRFQPYMDALVENNKAKKLESDLSEDQEANAELAIFTQVFKPNPELMRKGGAPESFISAAMEDWEKKLYDKKVELGLLPMEEEPLSKDKVLIEDGTEKGVEGDKDGVSKEVEKEEVDKAQRRLF